MGDANPYRLHTCYHCLNTGLMKILHREIYQEYEYWDDIGDDCTPGDEYTWLLLSCPVCGKLTLFETVDNSYGCTTSSNVIYPICSINCTVVPDNIRTAFESALKVKKIDLAICSLALRRVLEAICKDKNAKGKTLEEMIKDMISSGTLPPMFDDACWIIRQLGNSAAHADKKTFSSYQVDQTIEFIQSIINYLYSLPRNIKMLRTKIEEEKNTTGENDNANP